MLFRSGEEFATFEVHPDYEVNLFASEQDGVGKISQPCASVVEEKTTRRWDSRFGFWRYSCSCIQYQDGFDLCARLAAGAEHTQHSGIFIRKPQLQCRDYLVAGPYKELKKYKPQDWNEIEVVVKGGIAHCTCNGEVLEAALKLPPTGPIGLEADRGTMEYRRIQIKELP